jgi:hypothetical protein
MTELRYRIQVGNKYTYRNSSYDMERLVKDLIDGSNTRMNNLLAEMKGQKFEEPKLVKPEEITIMVESRPHRPKSSGANCPRAAGKHRVRRNAVPS